MRIILVAVIAIIFANEAYSMGKSPEKSVQDPPQEKFTPYKDSAGDVVLLANEDLKPFLSYGVSLEQIKQKGTKGSIKFYKDYIGSAQQFHSVRDCLLEEERYKAQPDLTKIDWDAIDWEEDAEVCLFRIASSYKTPDDMLEWFNVGGFENVNLLIERKSNTIRVAWKVKEKGLKYWANPIVKAWMNLIVYSSGLYVYYDGNNNITGAGAGNTIL